MVGLVKELYMAAAITRFRSRRELIDDEKGDELRQLIIDFPDLPDEVRNHVVAAVDQRTVSSRGWTFIMLSPAQNAAVVEWISGNSKRPQIAVRLWALCFTAMRMDTGEICMSRAEMADRLSIAPRHVSSIMSELVSINAIGRERDGRRVRYFMNPNVATHTTGKRRDRQQDDRGPVQLSLVP